MKYTLIILAISFLFLAYMFLSDKAKTNNKVIHEVKNKLSEEVNKTTTKINFAGLKTNINKTSIDLSLVLSGGPGKDGIPAINNPKFESIEKSDVEDDIRGVFVDIEGDQKFYPYNILVWHEIVNDTVGDKQLAITFCPLCGSAIVFDRMVDGQLLDFGVSGLLYESNLLMYDSKTESLWSQAMGQAVVGDYLDSKLDIVAMQLISFAELKDKYPKTKVLSTDTGYKRDYSFYPYGDYEENEDLIFPVSINDSRFPAKEVMYVVPYKDKSISFPQIKLLDGEEKKFELEGQTFVVTKDGGEIIVELDGLVLPAYYEMWFSWASHHQDDGVVWKF